MLDILFAVFSGRRLIDRLGDLGKQESPNMGAPGGLVAWLHLILLGGLSNATYTAYEGG